MTDHIILRGEYRYTDFGKETYKWIDVDKTTTTAKIKFHENEICLGIAYKF